MQANTEINGYKFRLAIMSNPIDYNILEDVITSEKIRNQLRKSNLDMICYLLYNNKNIRPELDINCSKIVRDIKNETINNLFQVQLLQSINKNDLPYDVFVLKGIASEYWLDLKAYKRKADIDVYINTCNKFPFLEILKMNDYNYLYKLNAYGEFTIKRGKTQHCDVHYDLFSSSWYSILVKFKKILPFVKKELKLYGCQFITFNKEATLLYYVLHFTLNHKLNHFLNLYEIKRFLIIHSSTINLEYFFRITKKSNAENIVYIVFQLLPYFFQNILVDKILISYRERGLKSKLKKKDKIFLIENLLNQSNKVNELYLFKLLINDTKSFFGFLHGVIHVNLYSIFYSRFYLKSKINQKLK